MAIASSVLLCALVIMAADSPTPSVPLSSIAYLDEGALIHTIGLVADFWTWDDGTENVLLVDTSSHATAIVVCSQGFRAQPGTYVHPGDEIRVIGEVFGQPAARRIFTDSDRVSLTRSSTFALTVESLSECWRLFEGDHLEVRGILTRGEAEGSFSLRGLGDDCSLALVQLPEVQPNMLGAEVVVAGTLVFDAHSMSVVLSVDSITVAR